MYWRRFKKKRITSKPSQSKNSNYNYRKKEKEKKNVMFFSMLFLLSLELSGLKLNLGLYLIFRLLVGVFSFLRFWFVFSFFCSFISQTITDRWHFSASEIMSDFKVFFLIRFIHFNIIRLSVRSLKYLSLKANWSKKILCFVFIIGY